MYRLGYNLRSTVNVDQYSFGDDIMSSVEKHLKVNYKPAPGKVFIKKGNYYGKDCHIVDINTSAFDIKTMKDKKDRIFSNVVYFTRIHKNVGPTKYYTAEGKVLFEHGYENHVDKYGHPTQDFIKWSRKGCALTEAIVWVKHPDCVGGCISKWDFQEYYEEKYEEVYKITSLTHCRSKLLLHYYSVMSRANREFWDLRSMLENGKNIVLVDEEGPDDKFVNEYKKIGIELKDNTIEFSYEVSKIALSQVAIKLVSGYWLAMSLFDCRY